MNTLFSFKKRYSLQAPVFSIKSKIAVLAVIALFIFTSHVNVQNPANPSETAFVNFSLGSNSMSSTAPHSVTLYGCNTIISGNGYLWNTANQVLSGIPYGWQTDTINGKPTKYYVSKYYISSPPVFDVKKENDPGTLYDIGLVIPDEFELAGKKPVQLVYLNYNILKPVQIKYFDVSFDQSFKENGQDVVPFKVACADFPWLDKNKIAGAEGASGIGSLDTNSGKPERLFLPYYTTVSQPAGNSLPLTDTTFLDCRVTILNDILLYNEVFFVLEAKSGKKTYATSINLKDFKDEDITITLHCKKRKSPPCGCVEPGMGNKGK
ncbi:MAG: hypothetical protein IM638_08735 [Bacteroidetes bacterium]|nr:hypothetical protein [Bacteroidota bacterium]